MLYLKMAPNPIILQIYVFVMSHFGTLFRAILAMHKITFKLKET